MVKFTLFEISTGQKESIIMLSFFCTFHQLNFWPLVSALRCLGHFATRGCPAFAFVSLVVRIIIGSWPGGDHIGDD